MKTIKAQASIIRILIVSMIYLGIDIPAYAYDIQTAFPSPNASDLGKYGEIPVSYYTGQAGISIPLYETSVVGMPLSISLSYNTSGLLMNNLPGWVGQGWSLQAGGVITRIQNGFCDEYKDPVVRWFRNYFTAYNELASLGDLSSDTAEVALEKNAKEHNYDSEPDIFTFTFMGKSGKFLLGNDGEWKVISDENLRVEFNIADTASYIPVFMASTGEIAYPKVIRGFTLVDEEGTRYVFGGDNTSIEYSMPFSGIEYGSNIHWNAVSWYLTKVEDRFRNCLYRFSYARGPFSVSVRHAFYGSFGTYCTSILGIKVHSSNGTTNRMFPYAADIVSPVYLRSISVRGRRTVTFIYRDAFSTSDEAYPSLYDRYTAEDTVLFRRGNLWPTSGTSQETPYWKYHLLVSEDYRQYHYKNREDLSNPLAATGLRCLNTIRICDLVSGEGQAIAFAYDRQGAMMHLETVSKSASGTTDVATYRFRYNDWTRIPRDYCLVDRTDHWGYFNGIATEWSCYYEQTSAEVDETGTSTSVTEQNPTTEGGAEEGNRGAGPGISTPSAGTDTTETECTPMVINTFDDYYASREPDETAAQCGMLREIVYPTGGCTTFEYEQNTYESYAIKTLQQMVPESGRAGGLRIRSITDYGDTLHTAVLSSRSFSYEDGELYSKPRYYWPDWTAKDDEDAQVSISTFQVQTIVPLTDSFSSYLGYGAVTEMQADSTTTRYTYINMTDAMDIPFEKSLMTSSPTPFDRYTSRGYKRGSLLTVTQKDNKADTISYTGIEYRTDDLEKEYVLTANTEDPAVPKTGTGSYAYLTGGVYKIFFHRYDTRKKTELTRYGNGFSTRETIYDRFDAHYPDGHGNVRLTRSETTKWNPERHGTSDRSTTDSVCYKYPNNCDLGTYEANIFSDYMFIPETSEARFHNDSLLGQEDTEYGLLMAGSVTSLLPVRKVRYYTKTQKDTLVEYKAYNALGLPTRLKEKGMPDTQLRWTSDGQLQAVVTTTAEGDIALDTAAVNTHDMVTVGKVSCYDLPETEAAV